MNLRNYVMKSALWIELKNLIVKNKVEYVSFDIFDTLLRRNCEKPTDIFERIGTKAIVNGLPINTDPTSFMNSRIYFEKKARLSSTNEDVTLDEIYNCSPYNSDTQSKLKKIELQLEDEALYADPIMKVVLSELQNYNVKIILISDMYLSREFLNTQIKAKLPHFTFKHLFVSSDAMVTKTTGNMFLYVVDKLAISAEKIVHIGDNRIADYQRSKEYGLLSILYNVPEWIEKALSREKTYPSIYENEINDARRTAALLMPQHLNHEQQISYLNGAFIHGPPITGFVRWINREYKKQSVKQLLFLMREGEIYKNAYDYLFSDKDLKSTLFYTSRKATFLPSVNPDNIMESLASVLVRKNYTVKNLLNDLQIDNNESNKFKEILDIQVSEMIQSESTFFDLETVITSNLGKIKKLIADKKSAFNLYLGDTLTSDKFALVDYGAGGTINLQFNQATTTKPVLHLLFTASERAYNKADEIAFSSFLPFKNSHRSYLNALHRTPEIFEYFLTGKSNTTLDYELDNSKYKVDLCEKTPTKRKLSIIEAFNEGVQNYLLISRNAKLAEHSLSAREASLFTLSRQVQFPTLVEADFLGSLEHDDNFGSDSTYTIIKEKELNSVQQSGLYKFWSNHLNFKDNEGNPMVWPQGVITKVKDDFISKDIHLINENTHKHIDKIQEICSVLTDENIDRVSIYGAGEFFDELELYLNALDIKIEFLIDKKAYFTTFKKRRYVVKSPEQAANTDLPIILASEKFVDEMIETINRFNISPHIIRA